MQLPLKVITLIGSNQGNYFENATACSKRMLKTRVAAQLQYHVSKVQTTLTLSLTAKNNGFETLHCIVET